MLKIGEFAKLGQVSPKALRLYDERGLLRPAWTDRFTGYRYYAQEQLARLHGILALKDLGFSLEQIGELLAGDLAPEALADMLRARQDALRRHIAAEQARLRRVRARLRRLEAVSGQRRAYEVILQPLPGAVAVPKDRKTMDVKIETRPAFTAVGLPYFGKNEQAEIPELWGTMNLRAAEVKGRDGLAYGLCKPMEADGRFHYLAGFGVTDAGALPEGMEAWPVESSYLCRFPLPAEHDSRDLPIRLRNMAAWVSLCVQERHRL